MRRISTTIGAALLLVLAASAFATPSPNSAVIFPRIFNDCPGSILTTVNNYPAQIIIDDVNTGCVGWANLHLWRFSEDGTNAAVFANGDAFRFCATVTITGTGHGEAGLQISPWWTQVDGRWHARTTDGEIACWGGRFPFYSFTANHGLVYVKDTPITMEIIYLPNGLSAANPATIEYRCTYGGNFTSGPLPFDEGNPAEDPPHGLWGILTPAEVGGFFQFLVQLSGPQGQTRAEWSDICFEALIVGVEDQAWGTIKNLYR
jgi:hypothetical protein